MSSVNWKDLHLTYEVDRELIRATSALPANAKIRRWNRVFFGFILFNQAFMTALIWMMGRWWDWWLIEVGCALSLALLGFVIWSGFRSRSIELERIDKSPQRDLRLTPQGIALEAADGWTFFGWASLSQVDEVAQYVSIELKNAGVVLLPKSSLLSSKGIDFLGILKNFDAFAERVTGTPEFVLAKANHMLSLAEVKYHLSESDIEKQNLLMFDAPATQTAQPTKKKSLLSKIYFWILFLGLFSIVFVSEGASAVSRFNFLLGWMAVFASWVITILLALLPSRFLNRLVLPRLSPTTNILRMYPDGFVLECDDIWNSFAWSRVQYISCNKHWIGFLLQGGRVVIPKSAFADEAAVNRFTEQAQELQREFVPADIRNDRQRTPVQVDMSNPYAPPRSQF